jgi:adhesin transport system outer membrane protein
VLAATLPASASGAQDGGARPTLPGPSGAPQSIDPAGDPLLRFMARTDGAEDFDHTIARAVTRHPSVGQAIAIRSETVQDRVEAKAELIPQLNVHLSSERSLARNFGRDSGNVVERSRPVSRIDAILSGEQLLYDFGATQKRITAAKARITASEADVADVATSAALSALSAYYQVLTSQTLIALGRAFVDRNKDILEDARFRFEQGYGPAGDIARVDSYVATAESQVAGFERQLSAASARYAEMFGTEPPLLLDRPPPPATAATDHAAALDLSRTVPLVAAGEARLADAKLMSKAARADRLPRVTAVVDAARYDAIGTGSDYDVRGRLVLNQSLSGKSVSAARTGRAQARVEQAEFARERAVSEAEREAGIAFKDVEALEHQRAALSRAYIANRRTRDLAVEQLKVARGNLIDLLRTERDYFDSATALVRGSFELDLVRYVLLARTGEMLGHFGIAFDYGRAGGPVLARPPIRPVAFQPPAPAAAATAGWSVQLGAFGDAATAAAHWNDMHKKIAGLSDRPPSLTRIGSLIAVRSAPVSTRAEAQGICASAAAVMTDCFIVAPEASGG